MVSRVLLASESPRRAELMGLLGIPFEKAAPADVDESYPEGMPPEDVPAYLARKKAAAYTVAPGEALITADTVVVAGGKALGKPKDEEDAARMLGLLSDRTHKVVTGVCIKTAEGEEVLREETEVEFCKMAPEDTHYYISRHWPMDKAGAYGIQEWIGLACISAVRGSYYNVVGLPTHAVYRKLREMGAAPQ